MTALTLCEDREAARLVFMGWPGQGEFEAATPQFDLELELPGTPPVAAAAAVAAIYGSGTSDQPSRPSLESVGAAPDTMEHMEQSLCPALRHSLEDTTGSSVGRLQMQLPTAIQPEDTWRPGDRQLGYVTVTRPIRQVCNKFNSACMWCCCLRAYFAALRRQSIPSCC